MSEDEDFSEWFIEYVSGNPKYGRRSPPHMIRLKDLAKEREKNGEMEAYSSIFRYATPDPYVGPLLSGFLLDFDDAENPERARKEAVVVVNELRRRYHIPEESIGICFSGGKGFHVVLSRRIFQAEPNSFQPQVWRSMAEELVQQCRLKTLDTSIYDCRRLWRLPNSKHSSGYFKVHITRSELENLNMDQIRDLATRPRTTLTIVPQYSPEAEAWYKRHLNKVMEQMKERKESFISGDLITLNVEPPCVKELFKKGVVEGHRNISRYMLTVYFKTAGKSLEECKGLLLDFNSRCSPSEREDEVLRQVEYLYNRDYRVGCGFFQQYCPGKEQCPLFIKRRGAEYPEDIKAEALKRLESPDLEQWLLKVYDKNIVRERENKLLCHYLELSGRRKNPREKQIILLMGDPGGGKTQLADETTRFHATKKRGRFSERALDYSDLSNYEILYIQEILGIKKEEHGISTLRFLSAEDRGYTVEITVKDPKTGKFVTEEYLIPAMTVVSTLTAVAVEPQLERRSWLLNVDESEEQTRLILQHKAQKEKERFQELMGLKEPDRDLDVLACTIDLLEDGEIVVPFPKSLTKALDVTMLRSRGDYDKVMSLIKLRAWYHQRQRRCLTTPDGTKVWIATPEDGIKSLELASKAMRRWRTQLDERLIEALPHIKKLVHEPILIGKDESDVVYGVTADRLAKKMRVADVTARKYLKTMAERGVLTYTQPKGKMKVYEFIVPEEEIEKKLELTVFEPNIVSLAPEFEKEAEKFLNEYRYNDFAETGTGEFEKPSTAIPHLSFRSIPKKPKLAVKEEKKPETTSVERYNAFTIHNMPPGEPCELCGSYPVEVEIHLNDGAVLRRCPSCFQRLRSTLNNAEFIEKHEDK